MVKIKTLLGYLNKLQNCSLPIIGDIMLDQYSFGEVERISPEAPVPVVHIKEDKYLLGGAGNVARNLKHLGANPILFSVIGKDKAGEKIKEILAAEKIEAYLVESDKRPTTIKTRIMAQNQQMLRIDREESHHLDTTERKKLLDFLDKKINSNYLLLSDYGKGCICPSLLKKLTNFSLIVDPKEKNYPFYRDFYLLTPNKKEAEQATGLRIEDEKSLIQTGLKLKEKFRLKNLVITLGPKGMAVFPESGEIFLLPTFAQKVFDVTGAGDTVIATITLGLASGLDLLTAALIANFAAGIVVAEIGTATASKEKLAQHIEKLGEINFTQIYP
ncbi:MAG TPA: D-glycero-beta-D-manno-heptose-7-phosphate kinase [Desulfonauticus sp.]|nr:MAG: PfkB domain protein [Desulfonauticus sp. 38_4375]HCO12456.1 D-glycero-beta-D-manno-heptose-7-phosphate kinase [Desulfonauticus sp.]